MTERRTIKQRPQKVWDAARAAYLAGEPGASVARRFDVGYGNLRHRAIQEGWTRKAAMAAEAEREAELDALAAGEGPVESRPDAAAQDAGPAQDPAQARAAMNADRTARLDALSARGQMVEALRLAARRLAEGRTAEAEGVIRAAKAFTEATGSAMPTMDELAADTPAMINALARAVEFRAWQVAKSLTSPEPQPPKGSEAFYFHLRDVGTSQPGVAERDRAWAAKNRPDLAHLWGDDGRVAEPEPPDDWAAQVMLDVLTEGAMMRGEG